MEGNRDSRPEQGVSIEQATQGDQDRSQALTVYPQDPTVAPPQDLLASVDWSGETSPAAAAAKPRAPVIAPIPQPAPLARRRTKRLFPASRTRPVRWCAAITCWQMLQNKDLTFGMALVGIAIAFGLGAGARPLAGSREDPGGGVSGGALRGTARHAIFLGGMVTFTHTISVFALGFVTLFLSKYVAPEKISPVLEVIASVSIVWIGAMLLFKRVRALRGGWDIF